MKCPKCGEAMVLAEDHAANRPATKKVQCSGCGYSEVRNDGGQKLLTEVQPMPSDATMLVE